MIHSLQAPVPLSATTVPVLRVWSCLRSGRSACVQSWVCHAWLDAGRIHAQQMCAQACRLCMAAW